jgi:TatD DNase family protein
MMLDSHCHINDDKLFEDRANVIDRAMRAGVSTFLCVGWDLESSKKALQIAHEFPQVYAAVGIHPENVDGVNEESFKAIKEMAADPKVLAIGEIGLDYHWNKDEANHGFQKFVFIKQIEMANELGLPISVHARDATADTYDILKGHPVIKKGVLHCYSGPTVMVSLFSKLGFYFGFDGPITYKGSIVPKENVKQVPLDRLLSETDSPYLTPVPFRGQTNEPQYIKEIVQEMGVLRGVSAEEIEKTILSNFKNLFHVEL